MAFIKILIEVISALFAIGAILLVFYFINKLALKRAKIINKEFEKFEKEQLLIKKQNILDEKKVKKSTIKKN